jgi:hypothetical protein
MGDVEDYGFVGGGGYEASELQVVHADIPRDQLLMPIFPDID